MARRSRIEFPGACYHIIARGNRQQAIFHDDADRRGAPQSSLVRRATGAVAALITRATGVQPYFVGKPNPLMMRSALNRHASELIEFIMRLIQWRGRPSTSRS